MQGSGVMSGETFHFDNARTGWLDRAPGNTEFDPNIRPWGKYQDLALGSAVRGAVLYLVDWTLREGEHAGQTHTLLFVATSANQVFAFSEEQLRAGITTPIWQTALDPADTRSGSNIPPPVGTCSTMVLESQNRRLFVLALTQVDGQTAYRAYQMNVDTGAILQTAQLTDSGSVDRPTFVGSDHDQRGGIVLSGGWLYAGFADFLAFDEGPYHGWLVGLSADNLSEQIYFPVTRNVTGGGVWGPGGLTASADGQRLYIVTGNAPGADDDYWDGLGAAKPPAIGDYFQTVTRVDLTRTAIAGSWGSPSQIPGWFGNETQGGGVALADLNGDGQPEMIVFHIDNPSGANHGYYRVGLNVDLNGNVTGGWSPPIPIPGWFGDHSAGGGVAVADLDGDGRPELIVFHIDDPSGGNHGYYRIGWSLDAGGNVSGGWSDPVPVPGWFGDNNQGGGIAVTDLNGDGRPELIVFHLDNPSGANHGYYRVGWGVDANGNVTGGWSDPAQIPGWFGDENQGGGIAAADIDGDGLPELIVFHIDNPSGANHGYYRIGRGLDSTGTVTGGWSDPIQVPGWFGNDNQAGSIAVGDLNGDGAPELVVFHMDHPSGGNHGFYRIGWGLHTVPALNARDWYMPTNSRSLNDADLDLGGSSALLIPKANENSRELLLTAGKDGDVYLLDSLNLGGWGGQLWKSHVFNGEARCAPAFYRSPQGDEYVYVSGHGNPGLVAFRVLNSSGAPALAEVWRAHERKGNNIGYGDAAGSPLVVSTSGAERQAPDSVLVWMCDGGDGAPVLHAYDALTGVEVYSSAWRPDDAIEAVPHYPAMACTEHSVFVGTTTGLACFRQPRPIDAMRPSYVVFHIDNPSGANHGYFRIGWDVGADGTPAYWTPPTLVPGWFGNDSDAGAAAVAGVNGAGSPAMIVFHIDNPSGANAGYYRVGRNLDIYGEVAGWIAPIQIPGWFGDHNEGGGIAIADLNGDGRPELIVFHIDNPSGPNHGYYRIGWNLNTNGIVTGGWTGPTEIPGWFGNDNAGGGIAVADLNGDGRPELIVFHIDNPSGANHGYYRVGRNVDTGGNVTGGWTDPIPVPGWFGNDNQGGGIAVTDLDGDGLPELIVFHIDNPSGGNQGYYRIGRGVNSAGAVTGGWTDPVQVPDWFGNDNQGGGIAIARFPWTWVWI